eukprot:1698165-Ditylum_brightwellii.AAC.1
MMAKNAFSKRNVVSLMTTAKENDPASNTQETWSSCTAFLYANIGADIGFGNILRFPALAYGYGGGAFF